MILIPAGYFWMGSESHYEWERPRHRLFINDLYISPTSVTRREYAIFLKATGTAEPRGWNDPVFVDADQPAVGMNWFEAVGYCEWLSKEKSKSYRLPTEAEWEKACRGDQQDADYAWGNEAPETFSYFQGSWT